MPYPNVGGSVGGTGGGLIGDIGGILGGMGGMGGMGGIMGGGLFGGMGGMMGGLGSILGGLMGDGGSRMSNGDEAGTMNEIEMFKLQQKMSQKSQQIQMVSNIMKKQDEMQKSIIGNLR